MLFAPALADLSRRPELWNVFQTRQRFKGSPHKDTETIPLRGPPTIDLATYQENFESENYPIFSRLMSVAELVMQLCSEIGAREIGRVMLVKLKAGGFITPHRDEGSYARYYARFHFPLTSNHDCSFVCGGERVHMAPGELWWFNHQKLHEVTNEGLSDRIHLIFDACAPGYTGALG